ncbi:MAG: hypothetical protein AAF330_06070 [Pseudomonadota bacterium]
MLEPIAHQWLTFHQSLDALATHLDAMLSQLSVDMRRAIDFLRCLMDGGSGQ